MECSPTWSVIFDSLLSTKARAMLGEGFPRMIVTCMSSSISSTPKYVGNTNLSSLTKRSSHIPLRNVIDVLARWIDMLIGLGSGRFTFWYNESARAWLVARFPNWQGSVKIPGSPILFGSLFNIAAEQLLFKTTFEASSIFFRFMSRSFQNLAYFGIWTTASINGILI